MVLAIDEACRWRSYDDIPPMPKDEQGLLELVFDRLAMENGSVLVKKALGYLSAARFGLSETELRELLSGDANLYKDFALAAPTEIPQVALLALISSLRPYLTERRVHGVDALTFSHKIVLKAAAAKYLPREDSLQCHRHLARYFRSVAFMNDKDSGESPLIPRVRALMELAFQTACASYFASGDNV